MQEQIKTLAILVMAVAGVTVFFSGISSQAGIAEGNCTATYTHYYLEPIFKGMNFGDKFFFEYNAKAEIMQCLCKNTETNGQTIKDYFNKNKDSWYPQEIEKFEVGMFEVNSTNICETIKPKHLL